MKRKEYCFTLHSQVEAENQKLNSLIGASGERRDSLNDAYLEDSRQTITELQKEIQTLRGQVSTI